MTIWLLTLACGSSEPTPPIDSVGETADTAVTTPEPPEWCLAAESGVLQEITTDHPAAPYFLSHPRDASAATQTVIFLAGGSGDKGSAQASWDLFFTQGDGIGEIRAVLPWSASNSLPQEADRIREIRDEVLACYGGDADGVHLSGTSNGGRTAFDLAYVHGADFATLLGAPGTLSSWSQSDLAEPLAGLRIFNGVGSDDSGWKSEVEALNEAMVAVGLDATFVEFPDQGHVVTPGWDETLLFDFWLDR
jgi:predicted esterase